MLVLYLLLVSSMAMAMPLAKLDESLLSNNTDFIHPNTLSPANFVAPLGPPSEWTLCIGTGFPSTRFTLEYVVTFTYYIDMELIFLCIYIP